MDISFSDPRPEEGDRVTVFVSVHNDGNAVAYDPLVELFRDGKLIDSQRSTTIMPQSVSVFQFIVTAEGMHEYTARARSDRHDTGEMEVGRVLKATEDESGWVLVSSPVAWVGMLAIVLSVVAIALNLLGRRSAEAPGTGDGDLWVESKDGED